MTLETVIYVLRVVNVILGLVAFVWALVKMSSYWSQYNNAGRAFTMSLTAFVFTGMYSSAEAVYQDGQNGFRDPILTFALVNMLYALFLTHGGSYYINTRGPDRLKRRG